MSITTQKKMWAILLTVLMLGSGFFTLIEIPENAEADTGGPDNGGYYYWMDSNPPLPSVNYSWVEISGTGVHVATGGDDGKYGSFPLDFMFEFYGTSYTDIYIHTNGYVSFINKPSEFINDPIPTTEEPNNIIAPYWDDLQGGEIYYQTLGTAPNRYFIVEWKEMKRWRQQSSETITFELILYEGTNFIKFQYKDVNFGNPKWDSGAWATVGFENQTGEIGLQYSYNSPSLSDSHAIEFNRYIVDYIIINNTAGPGGSWVGDSQYSTGNSDTFFAHGFNHTEGYLGGVNVEWESSDPSVGTVSSYGMSTTFNATNPGTCIITATYGGIITNETGLMTIGIPPQIENVTHFPKYPNGTSIVTVSANITDIDGVGSVTLYYSYNGISFTPIAMNPMGGDIYSGDIPGSSFTTIVYYYINVTDTNGFLNSSLLYSYFVDADPPVIDIINFEPEYPNATVDVNITIKYNDIFRLKNATLWYSYNGFSWFSKSMAFNTLWILFNDSFSSTILDPSKWGSTAGSPNINTNGDNEPSSPYSLDLDGSGDTVTSVVMDLLGYTDVNISFFYELGGSRDSPESGDLLYFEYYNDSGNWVTYWSVRGDYSNHHTYDWVEMMLPEDAYHSNFQFRLRSKGSGANTDNFFVDDIMMNHSKNANTLIPAPGFSTWVYYYFNTTDMLGNSNDSIIFKYYADGTPPKVVNVSDIISPAYSNKETLIFANITDDYSINFNNVMIWYDNGSGYSNWPMTFFTGNLTNATFTGFIPPANNETTIFYYVEVGDNASNANVSVPVKSYITNYPPFIHNITLLEEYPNGTSIVNITANITDNDGIASALLYYSFDGSMYTPVAMNLIDGDNYSAEIPGPGSTKTVYYYINASDNNGVLNSTPVHDYFADADPPQFGPVTIDPEYPNGTNNVNVSIIITDNINVSNASLNYSYDGSSWTYVDMILLPDDEAKTTIPGPGYSTWVYYYINATDISRNLNTSLVYNFYTDMNLPTVVDTSDIVSPVNSFAEVLIFANVTDDYGFDFDSIFLWYNYGTAWTKVPMAYISGNNTNATFLGFIPPTTNETVVSYYVEVVDNASNSNNSGPPKSYSTNFPPFINNITYLPVYPNGTSIVIISANITDSEGVAGATLYYSYDGSSYIPLPMTFVTGNYTADIPGPGSTTTVYFYINSTDNNGFSNSTPILSYLADADLPFFFIPGVDPQNPNASSDVNITLPIVDNVEVANATLWYSYDNSSWFPVTSGTATIPAPGYSTWVYYKINATDVSGNRNESLIHKYYADGIFPIVINTTDVPNLMSTHENVAIFTNVTDNYGIDFNRIYLWYNNGSGWASSPMVFFSGNYSAATFVGFIQPVNAETTVFYYVEIYDNASNRNDSGTPKDYSTNFPPLIENVTYLPKHPNASSIVTISANITDANGIGSVTLYYSSDGISYAPVTMNPVGGDTYSGDIPAQGSTTTLYYYINATDSNALLNSTPVSSYLVDSDPPRFGTPTTDPDPANETVDVEVNIHFIDDSEIIDAVLYYSYDGLSWTQIDMNLLGSNNANTTIPSTGFPTTVYYYINATEAAGNSNESITYTYPAGPELILNTENINFNPYPLENGSEVLISALISNLGEALDLVNVSFFLGNPDVDNDNIVDSGAVHIGTNSTINIGESSTALASTTWTPPNIGLYDVYIWVDFTNTTWEVNESNNLANKTLTVFNWVDSFDNLTKTESKQNITYYDGDARTGFGYSFDFEDSDGGFAYESVPRRNLFKWDSSNERLFFYIGVSDTRDEMYTKSLPKTLNETSGSWVLSAKFKITHGGHLQFAYPLFIADSSNTGLQDTANTIYFQYAAGDDRVTVIFRDSNNNAHGFGQGIGLNQEYLARVIYDHETKRLTLRLISYWWVRQASVIVGTGAVGNFTFGKIGVGGYKYWGSTPYLGGWTDDINFNFFGQINGTITSKPITIPANNTWSQLYINKTEPEDSNITVTIVDAASGEPIAGFINLTGSTINLTGFNPHIHSSIKLVANFNVGITAAPVMHYWAVNWEEINLAPQADAGPDGFVNEGTQYIFDGSASINGTGAWFNWSFGDGNFENCTNMFPNHTYETPGLYEVTLKVTNSTGWSIDKCWITVYDITKPVVDAGSDGIIDEDSPYYFNATGSYDPEGGTVEWYNWTFGDGFYDKGSNPTPNHTYSDPGVYTVILNVSDSAGNWNYTTIAIVVNDTTPPVANAGGDISTYAGVPIELDGSLSTDNNGTAGLNYSWDVDGDLIPDYYGVTTTHTYFAADDYTVTLNVTDKAGNWNVTAIQINIVIPPHPIANAGADGSVNEDLPYYMDGSLSINDTGAWFNWSFGDGSYDNGTNMFPIHTYEIPGVYEVTLNVTNSTGWSIDKCWITVYDVTKPVVDAGPDGIVNEDVPYEFDGTGSFDPEGGTISWYNWSFGDSAFDNGTNATTNHIYNIPDIYTVTLNVTDAVGNWNSTTIQVTVNDITKPVIDMGSDAVTEEDIPYDFDATGSYDPEGGAIVWYSWSFGDGSFNNGSGATPTHTYSIPGIYTVTLNATDSAGNWANGTITITVNDTTKPVADAGLDGSVDEDATYTFNSTLSYDEDGQSIAHYLWDFDDSDGVDWIDPDSTTQNPSWTYTLPGNYTVTLRVVDAAGNSDEDTVVIIVNDITSPVADAGPSDSVVHGNPYTLSGGNSYDPGGGTIVSYMWDIDERDGIDWDDPDYEGESVAHTFTEPGTYNVTLRVEDSAGNFHTDTVTITVIHVDTIPPAKPSNLRIETLPEGNALNIAWDGNTEPDLGHYELFFGTDNDTFSKLADVPFNTTGYTHGDLTNGMTYYYYLVAVDVNGNPSDNSDVAQGVPNLDTDRDGIPNPTDPDDDNDGLSDSEELAKGTNPLESDSDGDGHDDLEDAYPLDPDKWKKEAPSALGLWLVILVIVVVIVLLVLLLLMKQRGAEEEIIDEEPPAETEAALEESDETTFELLPSDEETEEPKKKPPRPPRAPKGTPTEEPQEPAPEETSEEPELPPEELAQEPPPEEPQKETFPEETPEVPLWDDYVEESPSPSEAQQEIPSEKTQEVIPP
ncbi:MAG: PKD domain-containing protein, partial [Thermoplasmata archaeon]